VRVSVGTNTFLSGLVSVIALPIWGLVRGEFGLVAGGLLVGILLLAIGYGLMRLEEPPKPPT
jgi:hypothetical protein